MEAWLKNTFPSLPNGEVIVFTTEKGVYGYNPANAAADFANVTAVPTHAALSALKLVTEGNWQMIFDDWKTKGLIN